MDSTNFYYRIYEKKTTVELEEIIVDMSSAIDTKITAITIIETRGELKEEFYQLKNELDLKRKALLTNEIAVDKYNTFSARFGANIIDGIVLRLTGFVFGFLNSSDSIAISNLTLFLSLLFPYVYNILFHGFTGQTIGKMLMGVKIFDVGESKTISFLQAVKRDFIPLLCSIAFYILTILGISYENNFISITSIFLMYILVIWAILEIITLLFNKKRRALHDLIAGTVVLKIKDR